MLTHHDLKRLAAVSGSCLTVFQPLRDDYSQVAKPDTRIVAALQEGERLIGQRGFSPAECDEIVRPLMKVVSNTDWTGRKGSLIMFRAPGYTKVSFWPETLAPRVHFSQQFLVLPLLPGLLSKHDFWLLTFSIKAVKLYRGSREGLAETALPAGVPRSLAPGEEFNRPDHSLRDRSSAGRSVGEMKGVQFGTSPAHELQAAYPHDFFQAVDRGIHSILAHDRQPLILAGVAREFAIYRQANTYSLLLAGAVHGSPESLGAEILYAEASQLMSAYSASARHATLREMDGAACRGLLVTSPAAVIEAARTGQIDYLIVSSAACVLERREETVNWAALATIRNSGRISVLDASQLASGVAAILRFRQTAQDGARVPDAVEELAHPQ